MERDVLNGCDVEEFVGVIEEGLRPNPDFGHEAPIELPPAYKRPNRTNPFVPVRVQQLRSFTSRPAFGYPPPAALTSSI